VVSKEFTHWALQTDKIFLNRTSRYYLWPLLLTLLPVNITNAK